MRILLNGLGCPYTGSRYILDQILRATPPHVRVMAIVPEVADAPPFTYPENVKVIRLKHSVWGMYLRIFFELAINLAMAFRKFDLMINLSNYGLCFTKRQLLYIHNAMILDMSSQEKIGHGNPNKLTRMALNTFLRYGEGIFVQTDHMFQQLCDYCRLNNISFPKKVNVLKPPFPEVQMGQHLEVNKQFASQFFYPASAFPHKRTDLAIEGIRIAREDNDNIGLVVTINGNDEEGIVYTGSISREEVYAQFRATDSLLFTSELETLGLPLLEAIYFEKPAVLPDRSYAHEIYGAAAVYYSGNQPAEIAGAIRSLMAQYPHYLEKSKERKQAELKIRKSWIDHWTVFLIFCSLDQR